jgi:EF-hand domain pair
MTGEWFVWRWLGDVNDEWWYLYHNLCTGVVRVRYVIKQSALGTFWRIEVVLFQVDIDGNGYISAAELQKAFEVVGLKIPGHEVRALVEKHDISRDGRLDMVEFKQVRLELKECG